MEVARRADPPKPPKPPIEPTSKPAVMVAATTPKPPTPAPPKAVRQPVVVATAPPQPTPRSTPKLPKVRISWTAVGDRAAALVAPLLHATQRAESASRSAQWMEARDLYGRWSSFQRTIRGRALDSVAAETAKMLLSLDALGPAAEPLRAAVREDLYRVAVTQPSPNSNAKRLFTALLSETARRQGRTTETVVAADLAWNVQEWELAGRLYAAAADSAPNDRTLRFRHAQALEKSGDLNRAAQVYRALLIESPPAPASGIQTSAR
jgi:hypothetical protein